MIKSEEAGQRETNEQGSQASFVHSDKRVNFQIVSSRVKSIDTNSSQVSRNARATSRRVTWSNKLVNREAKSFEFAGVNSPSMHRTRGWCSPSVDSFIANVNGHGVFTVKRVDVCPTESKTLQWVRYSNAFIEELNFRTMQNKVETDADKNTPSESNNCGLEAAHKDFLDIQGNQTNIDYPGRNNSRLWSEDFEVGHRAILAQLLEEKFNV